MLCGSYFVRCRSCGVNLLTIPWFSAERIFRGHLQVFRADSPKKELIAEGPADELVPYIRRYLQFNETLGLNGESAIITRDQLGSIQNNPLHIQRQFFSNLCTRNNSDESMPFALAQVVCEMGNQEEANKIFDNAIAKANRNWNRRLPLFAIASIGLSLILLWLQFSLWIVGLVGSVGPIAWWLIRRNRQHWVPAVGFMQRAEIAANTNMAEALAVSG